MPFNRPTLTEHRNQILRDMQGGTLPGVTNVTRFSVLGVFAKVWAGMAYLHDSFLDWIARQGVPWRATDENLEGWGNLKGVVRKPSSTASGAVTFQAVAGSTIPADTTVSVGGVGTGQTTEAMTADSSGRLTVPVAMSTTGAAGNVPLGALAELSSPVLGVQSSGQVTAAFTGGADAEDEESFRSRVLTAYRTAGRNGWAQDYIDWALSVPGVTRAWVNPDGFGAGTVVLYVMMEDGNGNGGFPVGENGAAGADHRYPAATGDQLRVADLIYEEQPVTALVIVCGPVPQPVDFVISGLGQANTAANRAAITTALSDVFRRASRPGGTVYPSAWNAALDALNLSQYSVVAPAGAVSGKTVGHMPVLGNIDFGN